ncbi:hypothetical protein K0M31_015532 [Melipona bicolor]|uniref:Uncharacterized protein n=1 Tax=Melipona bicolor TaxID=60889 RepID=A0AA40FF40_9HYME|nr:hypothetical protein K0M31_015532 [Melipona bicolor]
MKAFLLLLFAIFLMIMTGTRRTFAKERKSAELSNVLSSGSDSRSDREKKINKGFEWIIQGVHILGQVDNFISDRTKNIIRKLHTVYNNEDYRDASGQSKSKF